MAAVTAEGATVTAEGAEVAAVGRGDIINGIRPVDEFARTGHVYSRGNSELRTVGGYGAC